MRLAYHSAPRWLAISMLSLGMAGQAWAQSAAPAAGPASSNAPGSVQAKIHLENRGWLEVELVGREGDKLFYRERGGPAGASVSTPIGAVDEGEFAIQFDELSLRKAILGRNWPVINAILVPVVDPLLPFLAVKQNNVMDLTVQAGISLMRAAAAAAASTNAAEKEKSGKLYEHAKRVLKAIGEAEWYPGSETARLRGTYCLIPMGELKEAGRELDNARAPEIGDAAYGIYWFARGSLHFVRGKMRPAMDAVTKAVVFENKDIETFPDALLLSARCYEEMLEQHRARDVYYEVAKLFPQTEWGNTAKEHLQYMMDNGLTKAKEVSPVENVFFGLDEDVNAKVMSFLKGTDVKEETATAAPEDSFEDEKTTEQPKASDDNAPPDMEKPPPAPAPSPAPTAKPAATPKPSPSTGPKKAPAPRASGTKGN